MKQEITLESGKVLKRATEMDGIRKLWKDCFHDTEGYMDFYFSWKTRDNIIWGIYENQQLVSMVQLNPYQLVVGEEKINSYYIVGVATDANYRKQGLMRTLLEYSMREMYDQSIPFAYLMPAKVAIYLPFDFRIVTTQKRKSIPVKDLSRFLNDTRGCSLNAKTMDVDDKAGLKLLADFANARLHEQNDVYTFRDAFYYERMITELHVSNGTILAFYGQDTLVGYCAYVVEDDKVEVVEYLAMESYEEAMLSTFHQVIANKLGEKAIDQTSKAEPTIAPPIMFRIIHVTRFLEHFRATKEMNLTVKVYDPIIHKNTGVYQLNVDEKRCIVTNMSEQEYNTRTIDLTCDIADLGRFAFGQYVFDDPKVTEKLKQLLTFQRIHINEIV